MPHRGRHQPQQASKRRVGPASPVGATFRGWWAKLLRNILSIADMEKALLVVARFAVFLLLFMHYWEPYSI